MDQKQNRTSQRNRIRKGAYLLPNLCTTMNMFCGFYSIVAAIDGNYITAAYAILIAGIFDNLDGKIARATRSTSNFGVEFDSLADLLSFGMAPGIMMYLWVLKPLGRIGWLAGFLFVVCGALRLARFNTRAGKSDARFFLGLPIPAAAGMTAVTVMFCHKFGVAQQSYPFIFLVLLYGLSFLMVSTIRYSSFKKIALFSRMNFNVLVGAILVLIFIAAQPAIALFLLGAAYVVSGPLLTPWQRRRARRLREEASEEEDQVSAP